jgi:hypothetical protein
LRVTEVNGAGSAVKVGVTEGIDMWVGGTDGVEVKLGVTVGRELQPEIRKIKLVRAAKTA